MMLEWETSIKEYQCERPGSAGLVASVSKGVVFCCHQEDNRHSFMEGRKLTECAKLTANPEVYIKNPYNPIKTPDNP